MNDLAWVIFSRVAILLSDGLLLLSYFTFRSSVRKNSGGRPPIECPSWRGYLRVFSFFLVVISLANVIMLPLYFNDIASYLSQVCTEMIKSVDCAQDGEFWLKICWSFGAIALCVLMALALSIHRFKTTMEILPFERLYQQHSLIYALICFQACYLYTTPLSYPQVFFRKIDDPFTTVIFMSMAFCAIMAYECGVACWIDGLAKLWLRYRMPKATRAGGSPERTFILMEDRA
ncbi:hypothetical protein MMC28_007049 [Mycoblastus sanguinarius]|nr:hypothetical protein [Mycoblastus sanguinarius]